MPASTNIGTRVAVLETKVAAHETRITSTETRLTEVERIAASTRTVIVTTGRNVVFFVTASLTIIGLLFKAWGHW